MKFRPLHDRVVVKRIEEEAKTAGGIIIPDTAKEKPQQGEVVAVGPGARDEAGKINALDVKVGERVLFGKWSGSEVKIDGEDLLIMKESDILGVLDAPAKAKARARTFCRFRCHVALRWQSVGHGIVGNVGRCVGRTRSSGCSRSRSCWSQAWSRSAPPGCSARRS